MISTSRPLQLLHMDLFGSSRTSSFGGKYYCLVIVDDFSRFIWVIFLATKDEPFPLFTRLARKVQNEKNYVITSVRSDHGRELEIISLNHIVLNREYDITFLHLQHHNKMG